MLFLQLLSLFVVSVAFSQRETRRRQSKNGTFPFENRADKKKGKSWFGFKLLPGNLNAEQMTILSHLEISLGKNSQFSLSSAF